MKGSREHTPICSEWLSPDNNIHKVSNHRHERQRRKEKYQEKREPSGIRISRLMHEDDAREGSNYNYISTSERLRRENADFDDQVNETEYSWDLTSPITSVSHTRSPRYVGGGVRTQKSEGTGREGVGGGNSCNASRMTGHVSTRTGHTGVTQKMTNRNYTNYARKQLKKVVLDCLLEEEDEYPQKRKESQERHRHSSNARSTLPLHQTTTLAQMHPSSETPRSHVAINDEGMNNIEDVSSITYSNKGSGGGNNESAVDYGIDPTRGSFDLIIVPTNTKEQQMEYKPKRGHHIRGGHHHKKKHLTAHEAMSVAASITSSGGKGNNSQADSQVYPKMNNLTYWSSLSVKAAMTVMTRKNSSRGKSEFIAQVAANTILEAGKKYDQKSKKMANGEYKFSMQDLATKVSTAILEAGGEHTVATAVAVTIMNETLPSDEMEVKSWKQDDDDDSHEGELGQVQESSKPQRTDQELCSSSDESAISSMASKGRELEAKEAEIKARKQELEEATLLNQQKENEIRKRITKYTDAKKAIESKHMQSHTDNTELQKRMALNTEEEQILLKNQQLEAASRLNQQKEREIKERMMALDAATAALLKRAENVQNEIDHRNDANAHQFTNNALATKGKITAESYYNENEPMGNSRFAWEQQLQQQEQQRLQQQYQQQYQAHVTSPHQNDMGFLENISCKLYSMVDEACDALLAEDNSTQAETKTLDTWDEPRTRAPAQTPIPLERLNRGESSVYNQQPLSPRMVNDQQQQEFELDNYIAQLQAHGLADSELRAKTSKNRTRKGLPKLIRSFCSPFSRKDGKKQASKSNRRQQQPQVAPDMLQMTTHNNLRNSAPPNMGRNNTHRLAEKKNGNITDQPQEGNKMMRKNDKV